MSNQEKVRIFNYTLAIILLCLGLFFTCRGHASSLDFDNEFLVQEGDEDYVNLSLPIERRCAKHFSWAQRHYDKSKRISWYLPDYNDRDKAETCFVLAAGSLVPGDPWTKIVTLTITYMTKYGLDCMANFHEMNHYMYRAKYHVEMYEFYLEILKNEGKQPQFMISVKFEGVKCSE